MKHLNWKNDTNVAWAMAAQARHRAGSAASTAYPVTRAPMASGLKLNTSLASPAVVGEAAAGTPG